MLRGPQRRASASAQTRRAPRGAYSPRSAFLDEHEARRPETAPLVVTSTTRTVRVSSSRRIAVWRMITQRRALGNAPAAPTRPRPCNAVKTPGLGIAAHKPPCNACAPSRAVNRAGKRRARTMSAATTPNAATLATARRSATLFVDMNAATPTQHLRNTREQDRRATKSAAPERRTKHKQRRRTRVFVRGGGGRPTVLTRVDALRRADTLTTWGRTTVGTDML